MKFPDIELPSNRKFGFFFAAVFSLLAGYCLYVGAYSLSWAFAGVAVLLALIAMLHANLFLPLNKLWMRFGLLLGLIISPIVLGLLFFLIFTPVGLLMRMFGRDELRLRTRDVGTYWKPRDKADLAPESFRNQF